MTDHMNAEQIDLLVSRGLSLSAAQGIVQELSFSPSSVHIDRALSDFACQIQNREAIADMVCPVQRVTKPSDKFFKYDADTMFEEQSAALTGAEAMPGRVRYKISTDNFSTVDYGLMDFVSNKEIESADAPIDPQMHAVKVVTQRLDIAKERRVAGLLFATVHLSWSAALPLLGFGCFLCLVRDRFGLLACIAVHAAFNFTNLLWLKLAPNASTL